MNKRALGTILGAVLAASALLAVPAVSAQAYNPDGGVLYQLGSEACLKGRGNCAIYPKATELPGGRLVAGFEKATVPASGSAIGETLPVYKSDDYGTTWQPLAEVKAPAYMSDDPQYAKYTSNWTNPYFYVLPQDVGTLKAGTLLLASIVSGDDHYYTEHKAADPGWTPSNDGDRADIALALYASTDDGADWSLVNVIARAGWQGGSAGALGANISQANTHREIDPIWEPYLMAYDGELVAYYSDENDYLGYDPATGVPILDPDNDTAPDSGGQVLVHRTWDGTSASWSDPVVDVAGTTVSMGGGKTEIGGGRPGMANVVETTDGKWMLTYEYWGGGANVRVKIADDPLRFFADGSAAGQEISHADGSQGVLPYASGSRGLAWGGSPVLVKLPDGRLVYNASSSGDVWIDESGRSDGVWTQYRTNQGAGYSRDLTYVSGTGRMLILHNEGTSVLKYGEVDLGDSAGAYYQLVNRKTGQVIGTSGNSTDANLGNKDVPDMRLEDAGSASDPDTQFWHVVPRPSGVTLLNKAGGRAAEIWTGNAVAGQRIAQWVDDYSAGLWKTVSTTDGYVRFQSTQSPSLFMTGSSSGAALTLQTSASDGSQEWKLVQQAPVSADLTAARRSTKLIGDTGVGPGGALPLDATATDPSGAALHANVTGHAYLFDASGSRTDLGEVAFDADQHASVALPSSLPSGSAYTVAVTFDSTALLWDTGVVGKSAATVSAPAVSSKWGTAATVTATVSAAGTGGPATGQVVLTEGGTGRGVATLKDGKATFTLPPGLGGGDHTLTATYSGDDRLEAASASVTVTVVLPAAWSKTAVYQAGDTVSFGGSVYQAGWYSQGEQPGSPTGAWQQLAMTEDGTPVWTPSRAFTAGTIAVYQGRTFRADWWTRNETPGSTTGPWEEIATAPDGTALWTASRVFNAGDVALYDGQKYVARWYTRGQAPGTPNGAWAPAG